MPSKHFVGDRSSFAKSMAPAVPGRRVGAVVPGPRRAAIISGPTGRRCHRYGALIKRRPRVRSSRSRFGSSSGTPGPGVARELQFKSHFKGEAKFFFMVRNKTHRTVGAQQALLDWHAKAKDLPGKKAPSMSSWAWVLWHVPLCALCLGKRHHAACSVMSGVGTLSGARVQSPE
jgi:hypothetical protein